MFIFNKKLLVLMSLVAYWIECPVKVASDYSEFLVCAEVQK